MSITRSSENAEQPWSSIHQWQVNSIEYPTENQFPLAAQRYDLIIRLYKLVLKLLCHEKDHAVNQRRLKRAFETLILWGQQYGVSVGELDRLIDQSWRLRRSVLRTLTSIGRTLTDRLTPLIQQPLPEQLQKARALLRKAREEAIFLLADNVESEQIDERSDDDDSDTSSVFEIDSLSEIAEDLTSDVGNLMDLDALYDAAKENANFYEEEPAARTVTNLASTPGSAARVYTEMIQMRFPEANYELLDYLGRANYYRFVRGSQQREKNERQAEANLETKEHDATTVDESRFHDSGIGTSHYTGNYAETVMSFHHENGRIVRIPPLPEDGKKGLPFSCIACGRKVTIRSNRAWKRHLFLDLEPYNCLETSCRHTITPLGSRKNWVEHLAVHHGYGDQWQSFQCSLCLEETGQGEAAVTIHLEKHLQDIALAALLNNGDEESTSESDFYSSLSIDSSSLSDNDQFPTFFLPHGGCLTCRKRKKKCDELKPTCTHCFRGGFVCYGYDKQRGPLRTESEPAAEEQAAREAEEQAREAEEAQANRAEIEALKKMKAKKKKLLKKYQQRVDELTEKIDAGVGAEGADEAAAAAAYSSPFTYIDNNESGYDTVTQDSWWNDYDFITDLEPGQKPYWKLKPGLEPTDWRPATRAHEDKSAMESHPQRNEGLFVCMESGCPKSFRRKADLERHMAHVHTKPRTAARRPPQPTQGQPHQAKRAKNHHTRRKDSMNWKTIVQEADSKESPGKQTSESIGASISPSPLPQPLQVQYQPRPSFYDGTPMQLQPSNTSSRPSSPRPQHAHGGSFRHDVKNDAQGIEGFSKAEHEDDHRRAQDASVTGATMPKLDRTVMDIYNDELYSPDFTIQSASPSP
ncbi:hypothetical protein EV127DRAFT_440401 [Xylaria flabelliformis]|nr:hypothetical protein EV127DRAFT_440401 [Xylaria flabelliformis]